MSVQQVNERLAALTSAGTSVWLDQIRRSMIDSGELQRMVDEDSLRGVTSNPAIFEKAILGSPDYDEELESLAREGLSAREVYRKLAVKDVQLACDVLRPVYDETGGKDGYVSLEVAPRLAHDTEGTLEQARQYWGLVDRPNVMIKIPATDAGIPAIEEALYEGLNVNVTLLFAVSAYERVMEAFVRAMERRHEEGKPLDRHSVASFFVSRVDTEVDKRLEAAGRTDLAGRAGLANARAAYRAFQQVFEQGERFAKLREAGAPVQRPLWASTGVKNPQYPETLYVYGLVGPDTVNTMPLPTLMAARQQGEVTGATAAEDPTADLDALREAGIDLDDVTAKLLRDGIDAFMVPMAKLLDGIERKREAIVTRRPAAIEADLPLELEQPLAERVKRAHDEDVARRIWERDGTLWAPEGTPEVTDRLGWLTIADKMLEEADTLDAFRRRVQGRRADRRGAARHGRLEPRARGLPPLLRRRRRRAAPARPRLDRAAADRGRRARDRRREDAVHRLHQVGRHDRDDLAVQALPRAAERRLALRARHRPGLEPARARRGERLPARVPERPRDRRALLGAVVLRDRAGRAGRHRRAAAARGRAGRRPGVLGLRQPREQRRACGSASRSASSPARAATS